ncbi:hypothetical protein HDU67_006374 [Dinochytrium kinnereticum]|nr:hypothetical protein HDU67_006374 [Dinochytrium kinnereticum]
MPMMDDGQRFPAERKTDIPSTRLTDDRDEGIRARKGNVRFDDEESPDLLAVNVRPDVEPSSDSLDNEVASSSPPSHSNRSLESPLQRPRQSPSPQPSPSFPLPETPALQLDLTHQASTKRSIPKLIWTYWDTLDSEPLPWMISAMIRGWRHQNPSYTVVVLRPSKLSEHIHVPLPATFFSPTTTPQQRATWVRLAVLFKHGGIWVDASMIITGSLDALVQGGGKEAFAFRLEAFSRDTVAGPKMPVYETYFVATVPGGSWIKAWFDEYSLVFDVFECSDRYLDYLKAVYGEEMYEKIIQKINDPSYLKLTVASQKVLVQRLANIGNTTADDSTGFLAHPSLPSSLSVEHPIGPYNLLSISGYDDWAYARNLVERDTEIPSLIYKLRRPTRKAVEELMNKGGAVVNPRSVFGRFVLGYVQ